MVKRWKSDNFALARARFNTVALQYCTSTVPVEVTGNRSFSKHERGGPSEQLDNWIEAIVIVQQQPEPAGDADQVDLAGLKKQQRSCVCAFKPDHQVSNTQPTGVPRTTPHRPQPRPWADSANPGDADDFQQLPRPRVRGIAWVVRLCDSKNVSMLLLARFYHYCICTSF